MQLPNPNRKWGVRRLNKKERLLTAEPMGGAWCPASPQWM